MDDAGAPDFQLLEDTMHALSHGARLQILYQLRLPLGISDLRITPSQVRAGQNAGRIMSRQGVEEHLSQLVAAGLVQVVRDEGDGRGVREFMVNPQRLYQVMEEFRRLGTIFPTGLVGDDTKSGPGTPGAQPQVDGPHLVVVHGLREGETFPLAGKGPWTIGRGADADVPLPHDPYVSLQNSEVRAAGRGASAGHVLSAVPSSRNGTWLNWRRLGAAEKAPLRPGDVVGCGRTLLVFRDG